MEVPQVLAFQVLRAYMVRKETRDFLDIQGYLGDLVHEVRDGIYSEIPSSFILLLTLNQGLWDLIYYYQEMIRYAVTKDYWVERVSQDHQVCL